MGLVIAASLLAGCATAPSETVAICPPVAAYDGATLRQAARELEALPEGSALAGLVQDCALLRARLRAACPPARQAKP